MNLKEFIHSEIRNTLLESVNEDRVNDFFYIELKKQMWNRRKDYSDKIKKLNGLEKTEYLEDLYIKLNGKFARDIKGHGMDLYKRLVNDKVIKEDAELDQAFLKAEPVEEETKRDYKKEYEKYGKSKKAKKYRAELNKYNRQKGTYGNGDGKDASHKGGKIVGFEDESKNRGRAEKSRLKKESVNEGKFYITRNLGRGQGKALVGGYDLKRDKKLPPKVFKSYKDAQKEVERLERGGSMGGQMTAYFVTDKDMNMLKPNGKKMFENINEEQLDEKLITFSNRAPYGQIVFMAGGAGSGKGYAIDNFIDAAGFKVRDVDEMKKAVGKLDQLKKFSIDKWYKKYYKKLSDKPGKGGGLSPKAHIEEFVLGKGLSISDISKDLKNPNNVASLHYIVDAMGLKDKWVISMLSGKENKETLPNLLFDITAKKVSSITDVIKQLEPAGYDSKNIHLIWVLANFHVAIKANKERDRMVPEDILLQTHEGAGKTMWSVMTKILPKGLNGRIDVILNNRERTIPYKDKDGKPIKVEPSQQNKLEKARIVVKDFKSLPIKKQGGGVLPEKTWKMLLKSWVLDNAPKTIDLSQDLETSEEYMI